MTLLLRDRNAIQNSKSFLLGGIRKPTINRVKSKNRSKLSIHSTYRGNNQNNVVLPDIREFLSTVCLSLFSIS